MYDQHKLPCSICHHECRDSLPRLKQGFIQRGRVGGGGGGGGGGAEIIMNAEIAYQD